MTELLTIVLTGLVSGTIYSLIASGLVLAYSTTGIFNFAQGAVAFCAAYTFYELNTGLHMSAVWSALIAAGVLPILLGLLLNRIVFRHLAAASEEARVVATVGLMLALPSLALYVVELLIDVGGADLPVGDNVFIAPGVGPVPKSSWQPLGSLVLDSNQAVVLVAAVICAAVLYVIVRRTRLGLRMRASIDRPELASLRGIDPVRTSSIAWILSMLLAGIAGIVGAPIFGLGPATYTTVLFVAAVAAVIGGLRSIPLAFLAGMGLAVLQNVVVSYVPIAQDVTGLGSAVPFILLLAAIWLLGRDRGRKAGTAAEEKVSEDYLDDLPLWRRVLPWVIASVGLLFCILFVADRFWLGIVSTGLALSLVFLSITVVTGLGGMVSLAQASFVSVGAVTAGLLLSHGLIYPLAALGGGLAAVVLGLIVATPSLRLGSLAFSLSTLALAFIVDQVVLQIGWFGGGVSGRLLNRPDYGWLNLRDDRTFSVVLFVLVLAVAWLVRNLTRSISGRAMTAVRSSELAATAAGISQVRVKLGMFVVAAAIAGTGGVLLASVNGQMTPNSYPTAIGILWLAIAVTFGVRRPAGAVIAGLVFAAGPELISWVTDSTRIPAILFGLGAVNLATNPEGSVAQIGRMLRAMRDRARRGRGIAEPGLAPGRADTAADAGPSDPGAARSEQPDVSVLAGDIRDSTAIVDSDLWDASEVVFRAEGLRAGYGATTILRDVSLSLRAGTITAVLGANGAGKSTLCRAIAGTLQLTGGDLTLGRVDIKGTTAHARARAGLVMVPETRGIFPGLTVRENLDVWLSNPSDVAVALNRFPVLAERSKLSAGNLSGGEQQMLALAPLLVRSPDVLIIDEPSLGLAPRIVAEIFTLFEELRDRGCALLVIEEKATDALRVADRAVIVEAGAVVYAGPAQGLDERRVASAYLGVSTD